MYQLSNTYNFITNIHAGTNYPDSWREFATSALAVS